jgi:tetratricopeptide (TPR) repeat protein
LLAYIEQSLELYRRLQDPHGVSQALLNLSVYHTQTGAYEKALAAAREAEVVVRGSELASAQAWTHSTIAELLLLQGLRLDEAQEHLESALALFREANQREGILIVEHHLGDLARQREDWTEALMLYEKSLAAAVAGDDRRMQARCCVGLGLTALAQGDVAGAHHHLEAAAALLESLPAFLPPGAQAEFAAACARTGIAQKE